ncbi:MAG: CARDB domain-containing protein [Candidatus Odinarchaeota archaeon]
MNKPRKFIRKNKRFLIIFITILILSLIKTQKGNIFFSEHNSLDESNNRIKSGTVFGNDDRMLITPTTAYPWGSIVKLHLAWGEYHTFGSGVLIDKNHVLTAAHCVYSHTYGGWADSIKIVPGEDNGNEPYGHAWVENMRCYEDWIDHADRRHDFAVISLDRDIGQQIGWMEIYTTPPSSSIYSGGLNTAGYPSDLDNGLNMYWCYESGEYANEYNHWYWLDTAGGQSGSPIWIYNGVTRYILSVHAYGSIGSNGNYGTRINQVKFDCINNWLTADSTAANKPDLSIESNIHAGFNTTLVGAGLTDFKIWSTVRNIGTIQSNSFSISYYASTDTTISETDYLIGIDELSPLSPTDSVESQWVGTFPINISSGEYFIGWIIDVNNQIDEFNENNNMNYIWNEKVQVDATPPLNPTICMQLNGSTKSNIWQNSENDPYFTWNGASDSDTSVEGYFYYWGFDPNGISSSFTTQSTFNPPAISSDTYYLRIKTKDIVGNTASWKTLYVFKYDSTSPLNPTSCTQLNGMTESNVWQGSVNDPSFNWSGVLDIHSGIAGYHLYWGSNPNGTSPIFISSTNYDPPALGTGIYYLRVQTIDIVGNNASWTTLYIFKYNQTLNDGDDGPTDTPNGEKNNNNNSLDEIFIIELLIALSGVGLISILIIKNRFRR